MLSRLLVFLVFLSFLSCETEVEEFLYNKYDSDYAKVIAKATALCKTESDALQAIERTIDFDNFSLNSVYKITFSGEEAINAGTFFIRISAVSSSSMTLQFLNTNSQTGVSGLDIRTKSMTFSSSDAQTIYDNIATGVCTVDSDTGSEYYSSSSLTSDEALTFTHVRSDDEGDSDDDTYTIRTGTYTVSEDYPIFIYLWNSTISQVSKSGSSSSQETDFKITKTEISDYTSECSSDDDCDDILSGSYTSCTPVINSNSYSTDDSETEIVNFSC